MTLTRNETQVVRNDVRPAPPDWMPEANVNAPNGWQWVSSDEENMDWAIGGDGIVGKRCRFSEAGVRCPNDAEVVLYRRNGPWAYCTEHMFGRWIENGVVMHWKLAKR